MEDLVKYEWFDDLLFFDVLIEVEYLEIVVDVGESWFELFNNCMIDYCWYFN